MVKLLNGFARCKNEYDSKYSSEDHYLKKKKHFHLQFVREKKKKTFIQNEENTLNTYD